MSHGGGMLSVIIPYHLYKLWADLEVEQGETNNFQVNLILGLPFSEVHVYPLHAISTNFRFFATFSPKIKL